MKHVGAVIQRIVISWPTWYLSEYILHILNAKLLTVKLFDYVPFVSI